MFGRKQTIPPERRQAELRRMEQCGQQAQQKLTQLRKLEQELRFAGLSRNQIETIRPEFYQALAHKVLAPAGQATHELHQVLMALDNALRYLPGGRS